MSGLLYNRDNNITGVSILGSPYSPDYGSSVSFFTQSNVYETQDNYFNYIPYSPNNLLARLNLRYTLDSSEAQEMAVFFENLSGRNPFEFADGSNIYKNQTGYLENYSLKPINVDVYSLDAQVLVSDNAPLLSWSGKAFVDEDGPAYPYTPLVESEQYQVVYFESGSNKIDNFFYAASGGFPLDINNTPDQVLTNWSRSFSVFTPDVIKDIKINPDVSVLNFKNSYKEIIKAKNNIHTIKNITLEFNNRTDRECKSILHFLEGKAGYRRFSYTIPQTYNRPKVFYSPSWEHVWNYKDSNSIKVQLIEDPLGIVPDETYVT